MSRPSKYKPEHCDLLAKCLRQKKDASYFCHVSGISKVTFYTWLKKHPEFRKVKNGEYAQVLPGGAA